jgi:hypothetical protein
MQQWKDAVLLWIVMILLAGCSFAWPGVQNPTIGQLPNLNGYRQTEGANLTEQLSSNQILNTLLLGQPQLAVVADIISQAGACAQQQGVVNWRVYVGKDDPAAAGVVVIASQKQATNPQVLLQCSVNVISRRSLIPEDISPCSSSFSYEASNDTYYVFYAASKEKLCTSFQQALPAPR